VRTAAALAFLWLAAACPARAPDAAPTFHYTRQTTPWLLDAPFTCKLRPNDGSKYADGFSLELGETGVLRVRVDPPSPATKVRVPL
jgi:hypothetical protein